MVYVCNMTCHDCLSLMRVSPFGIFLLLIFSFQLLLLCFASVAIARPQVFHQPSISSPRDLQQEPSFGSEVFIDPSTGLQQLPLASTPQIVRLVDNNLNEREAIVLRHDRQDPSIEGHSGVLYETSNGISFVEQRIPDEDGHNVARGSYR